MTRPTWTRVLTRARKLGVALLGVLGVLAVIAGSGLLPEPYARWAPVIVSLATALGVYRVPNAGQIDSAAAAERALASYNRGRLDQLVGRPHPDGTTTVGPPAPPPQARHRGPSHL